jgi:glycosyltransferase involved in cell wall biosynthesis
MRILYLVQYYNRPDEPGGSRPYQFARNWTDMGHQVEIVTGGVNHKTGEVVPSLRGRMVATERDGEVTIHRVRSYASYRGSFKRRYLSFLSYALSAIVFSPRRPRPDLVFASSTPLTTGMAGGVLAALCGSPFVFEARDLWPKAAVVAGVIRPGALLSAAEGLERWICSRADRIVVVSRGDRRELIERGLAENRVHWVPNGVDDWMLADEPEPLERPDGAFEVAYAGALGRWNQIERLLDVAREAGPAVRFTIVGDGDERAALQERARREGISSVSFEAALPKRQAFRRLQRAQATIVVSGTHPHYRQWLPNKIFDYMASGRPVVVLGDGELADLVRETGCGVVGPCDDPPAAGRVLRDLADADRARLEAMGRAGRKAARSRFARDDLARSMIEIFRGVTEGEPWA